MRCEQVRPLLPELAEAGPRAVGPAQVHLAGCATCATGLARFRDLLAGLSSLRDAVSEPSEGFLGRLVASLDAIEEQARPGRLLRFVSNERARSAALSLGGAAVGATAVGLVWWRRSARRALPPALSTGSGALR